MELRKINFQDAKEQWKYTRDLPETYCYLWDGDELVGEFRIRHHLTDALRAGSGHIGYSIKKNCRGKGYGTKGLELQPSS